jgi:hypothetical protein
LTDAAAHILDFDDLPESEQAFVRASRQVSQRRRDARVRADERAERDQEAVQDIARAMFDLADGDASAIDSLDRAVVAAEADVELVGRRGDDLWTEAGWLARDVARRTAEAEEAGKSTDSIGFRVDYKRDLRIAYEALASAAAVDKKACKAGAPLPYTRRQAQLVRAHEDREKYLSGLQDAPGKQRVVVWSDADRVVTAPIRFFQSGDDRFSPHGRGYVYDAEGYVGGSSTQPNGGTCFQRAFVEKGKRSSKSAMTMRIVAATPKVGSRRRGIVDKDVLQRIEDLDNRGWSTARIAENIGETVSRVKGAIHAIRHKNDIRFHTGMHNDRRMVHRRKRDSLDQIHGNTRTDCREIIRADKDEIWESFAEFADWYNKLPIRPQKATWVRDDHYPERVTKPHLVWILPEGSGVWYDNKVGMALFNAAAAALTRMCGGDPGGLANTGDLKLPTSPHTVEIDIETEHLPTLSEIIKTLGADLKNDADRTMRAMSVEKMLDAGIDKKRSGALYSLLWKRAWEIALLWQSQRSLVIDESLDRRALAGDILDAMGDDEIVRREIDRLDGKAREAAEKAMSTAARNVAEKFGLGLRARSRGYDVGAAEILVEQRIEEAVAKDPQVDRKRVAQQAGQDYSRRQRVDRSIRRIADAMRTISADGKVPDEQSVQAITGQDIRTVMRHWDAAVALIAARQIVQHVINVPEPDSVSSAFSSRVRGATVEDALSRTCDTIEQTTETPVNGPVTLENILSSPVMTLVRRLRPVDPSNNERTTGRNLVEFCRSGVTVYRSQAGFRANSRSRRKGVRVSTESMGHPAFGSVDHLKIRQPA